jgi:dCMP deaminase
MLDKVRPLMEEEKHRLDYLSWDEYFMGIAQLSALRSKDPSTQVGACIVDGNHKVVSIGYNGMPRGVDDDKVPWGHGEGLQSKYLYVCHAEFNAILNTRDGTALNGCTLYVTLFPCNECAKAIIQVGIKKVVYLSDKHSDGIIYEASRNLLKMAGVDVEEYAGKTLKVSVS